MTEKTTIDMSTTKGTKKDKLINLRITEEMSNWIEKLGINVSDTCRMALQNEIEKLKRGASSRPHGYHGK